EGVERDLLRGARLEARAARDDLRARVERNAELRLTGHRGIRIVRDSDRERAETTCLLKRAEHVRSSSGRRDTEDDVVRSRAHGGDIGGPLFAAILCALHGNIERLLSAR